MIRQLTRILLICTAIQGVSFSQTPTLPPEATVNSASGEMGFSLPLGTVQGVNGYNYPVNLNYHSGIRLLEEASPAGLGFSYGPGGISRKVVYVPDDNNAGSYYNSNPVTRFDCDTPWWKELVACVLLTVDIIRLFGLGDVFTVLSMPSRFEDLQGNPLEYTAGGPHENVYSGNGQGYLKGGTGDLPDIYFLNTPYISGKMLPKGPSSNGQVEFRLLAENGAPGSKAEIVYDVAAGEFIITMENGTKLFIGGTEETKPRNSTSTTISLTGVNSDNDPCYQDRTIEQRENVPSGWLLRKVLGADYHDGDGDNNPLTNREKERGAWIAYCYSKIVTPDARRLPMTVQGGMYTTVVTYPGYTGHFTFEDIYFDSAVTPLGKVKYQYADGRLDDAWFHSNDFEWYWELRPETETGEKQPPATQVHALNANAQPVNRKILDRVMFYNADNTLLRTVELKTSYTLRPHSFYSMKKTMSGAWGAIDGNPDRACLTLDAIRIYDNATGTMTETKFKYAYNPDGMNPLNTNKPENVPKPLRFYREPRDAWGYYLPQQLLPVFYSDFNFIGDSALSTEKIYGIPHSSGWSMTSMALPSGVKLAWEYESNRYDACNNIPVSSGGGRPRFAGGPRVKKVTIFDDANRTNYLSYFYTADDLFVEGRTNSSGHASAEPFPYLWENDHRNDKTRGSFYAPTNVSYEKIKIVKNYSVPSVEAPDGKAPQGYTETEYITSHDYQNTGKYGQIDEGWRRGGIKSVAHYDANRKLLQKTVNYYRWIPNLSYTSVNSTYLSGGTVQLTRQTVTKNGVTSEVKYEYADQISTAGADRVPTNANIYNYAFAPLLANGWRNDTTITSTITGFSATGSFIGNTTLYSDLVTLIHEKVQVGPDQFMDNLQLVVTTNYDYPNLVSPLWFYPFTIASNEEGQPSKKSNYSGIKFYIQPTTDAVENVPAINVYVTYSHTEAISPPYQIILTTHYYKIPNLHINLNGSLHHDAIVREGAAIPPAGLTPEYTEIAGTIKNVHFNFYHGQAFIDCKHSYIADRDGKPNRTTTTNSDGKATIQEMIPAFTQPDYSAMLTSNILAPVCQTTTLGKGSGAADVPYVVSSQATKWSKSLGTPAWVPCTSYIWNANFQSDGTPDKAFADFNHTSGAANANWRYSGSIDRYTANSQAVETIKPLSTTERLHSTTVYGHGTTLPIATIVNANFRECGVFTCDYNLNETGSPHNYFDKDNGWEIGVLGQTPNPPTGTISTAFPHFGQSSLRISNGEGLMRSFKVRGNTTYELSLWVRVASGSMPIRVEYRKETAPITDWPVQYNHPLLPLADASNIDVINQGTSNGAWKLVKIPMRIVSGDDNWIRISLGFHGATFAAYIDDVRFAPVNAMVSSTYYDRMWRQPVMSVDANNNPGQRVSYDSFGRPVKWDKINPAKTATDAGYATVVQSKEYHFTSASPLQPTNPVPADGSTILTRSITLGWTVNKPAGVQVNYLLYLGTDPNNLPLIATLQTNSYQLQNVGFGNYYWRVDVKEQSGKITSGYVWLLNFLYKPPAFPIDWQAFAKKIPNEPDYRIFIWSPITSEVGLPIRYFVTYKDSTHEGICNNCQEPEGQCCYRANTGPDAGSFLFIISDGMTSVTNTRSFPYPASP